MQEKDIKRLVTKQLKSKFPHWNRLTKKEKKTLAQQAIQEVMASYKQEQTQDVSLPELTNMPALPLGIISLSEMEKYIEDRTRNLLPFTKEYQRNINDHELRLIDTLLDNRIVIDHRVQNLRLGNPSDIWRFPFKKTTNCLH